MTGSVPTPQAMTPEEFLARDNRALRAAGGKLAEAALYVVHNYDGLHRLSLAVSEWSQTVADEGGRPHGQPVRDDTAELVEALEAIAAGAPTERPDWYEGDNGTDIALNAAHIEHFRVAEIARAALAKWKERNDE